MKNAIITIDWNNLQDIKAAEKKKLRLENNGYTLIRTVSGLVCSVLVYAPPANTESRQSAR